MAEVLPPLYAGWMADLLPGPIPAETNATCDECAMCPGPGERPDARGADAAVYFDPLVKCCTFVPVLPNFLAGRILLDPDPALARGRASVEARIAAGVAVTPLGVGRTPTYVLLYRNGSLAFGRSRTLRCPHFVEDGGGRCGIWRHRESTCATFFCKHVRGAVGKRFWTALHQLLSAVETALARFCVLELDVGAEALVRLFAPSLPDPAQAKPLGAADIDGTADAAGRRALFGRWAGCERELYEASARLVERLRWDDVTRIGGATVRVWAEVAREAHKRLLSDETPGALAAGPVQLIQLRSDRARLVTYSPFDPFEVPRALLDAMRLFDGRPTAEALRAIAAELRLEIEEGVVRRLADFDVLVECPAKEATP